MSTQRLARLKTPLVYVMGSVYVIAGVGHFLVPDLFAQIVPPQLPAATALVYLSGIAEIGLGIGVMVPRTRRVAAWGLVALLLAVFPANVYMATSGVVIQGAPPAIADPGVGRWVRLPLQVVLVVWAWWYTADPPENAI
ncbi:hypothetical protein BV210_01245 [Halorientalis sp. IM1011]|uniref:DoxX family protein n=1 Tax=Halorientalis sp. IM1011 TaxID=1932360 RepID=UPI00097CC0F7|nr:DoxX family membrane protein [Halorientalis sp. IM1011]AQL41421.1 hypothetical protein BV210_01245 [Halorientalis sp. IM1011]